MNSKRIAAVTLGAAALVAASPLAPASAINNIKGFGVQETLKNYYNLGSFNSEIGYTVKNLKPSTDPVPFPVRGRLYESGIESNAIVGTVNPLPNNFRARTPGGADYPSLPVSTLSGAPLGQGGMAIGKLYFDVVGENPDSVIFNYNYEDLLGWVGPQPIEPATVVPGTEAAGGSAPAGGSAGGSGQAATGSTGPNKATPPDIQNGGSGAPVGPNAPANYGD